MNFRSSNEVTEYKFTGTDSKGINFELIKKKTTTWWVSLPLWDSGTPPYAGNINPQIQGNNSTILRNSCLN